MFKKPVIFLGITAGVICLAALLWAYFTLGVTIGCGLDKESTFNKVRDKVIRSGLNPQYLTLQSVNEVSCEFTYSYKDGTRHIEYVVAEDIIHGPKIFTWHYQ